MKGHARYPPAGLCWRGSEPWSRSEADRASCCDVGGELEEVRGSLGLGAVILPRGVAGDVAPFVDGREIEFAHGRTGLLVDVGDFEVVFLRALAAECFQFGADGQEDVLMVLGQGVEDR